MADDSKNEDIAVEGSQRLSRHRRRSSQAQQRESRTKSADPTIPLEITEDDIIDPPPIIKSHRRASWSGAGNAKGNASSLFVPPRPRKFSMGSSNCYYFKDDDDYDEDCDNDNAVQLPKNVDVLNRSSESRRSRRHSSVTASTTTGTDSTRPYDDASRLWIEEASSTGPDSDLEQAQNRNGRLRHYNMEGKPSIATSPAIVRKSSGDVSTTNNSQTSTIHHSNQKGAVPSIRSYSTANAAELAVETDEQDHEDKDNDEDDHDEISSSRSSDAGQTHDKSLASTIWASLVPPKSWRDVTLGQIVDGMLGVIPEVTSGDWSSLAQLFFDNLSTILAAIYAIQDLAHIQPTTMNETNSETMTPTDDVTIDKNVSLQTLDTILFQQVATGMGLALFLGNTYYSWLARRRRDEYMRDYTALPIGISTPYAFAMVFNIIYPIYYQERSIPGVSGDEAFWTAYRVSLAANFVSGLISCIFGIIGPWILRVVPPHVLLIPAAGICIAFLGLEQVTKSFSAPIVGFNALFWVYLSWYGTVRMGWGKWRMPEAVQVLLVGIILGWLTGLNSPTELSQSAKMVGWIGPKWAGTELWDDDFKRIGEFLGLIIPLGITAPTLTLMCLVSTKEAGDPYPVREVLVVDGLGTILASMFGSPFGTVVYIGHPSHKRSGALISYSFLNGILYLIFSWFGLLGVFHAIVNPAAVGPVVFLIGLYVNEDVLDFLAPRHFAAYIIGIIPSICDWVVTVSGRTPVQDIDPNGNGYNTQLLGTSSNWFGLLALKRGSLLISVFWTAIIVKTIDRKWIQVSLWSVAAALFALFGLIHSPQAGFEFLRETHWEQCRVSTGECWENAEQWMFSAAYIMLTATAWCVNAAKQCDSAIQDEIDDNYSSMAFDDWFAYASKQTFVAEDNRSQSRSYLPAIREIQQFQRHVLRSSDIRATTTNPSDSTSTRTSASRATTARPAPIAEGHEEEHDADVDTGEYVEGDAGLVLHKRSMAGHL